MTNVEVLCVFVVMALATFLTRSLPFLILGQSMNYPLIKRLGQVLPVMIMTILVFFGLTRLSYQKDMSVLLTISSVSTTVCVHLLLKNPLLSILLGTGMYVVGLQMVD